MLVLIIDDNPICAAVVAAYFRHRGVRTLICRDGEEGLAAMRRERPDAVLLDVAMPRMDGVTFLETLRGDSVVGGTPVVVTTAVTDPKISGRMTALGVLGYAVKGQYSLEELYRWVVAAQCPPAGAA